MLNSFEMRSGNCITFVSIALALSTALFAQDRGIEFVSGPKFELSDRAFAAGIDGTLTVSFKVDRTGNVKGVSVLAGPIWPCKSTPSSEIKEVRELVKENILASRFSPATKGGKPIDASATLDFAIGQAYREAIEGRSTSKSRWVVDVGSLQAKATALPKPSPVRGIFGAATVRVLIGENGDVVSAGTVRGHPALHGTSRQAACDARFPPTTVQGKAVKVTGLIHYEYEPGNVRVRQ